MTIDIASAVEGIVAAVADEHGLFEARDLITPESTLNDQLGMDEADIVEVILRAENRFGISLPVAALRRTSVDKQLAEREGFDYVTNASSFLNKISALSAIPLFIP